jgi:ABC-2 type transport system ATP-binding protein
VIRAMLHLPALLVLDEPTTGVDPVSRADLWWLIARAAAAGAAVVLTTTYLDEAERAATVLVLDDGMMLARGTPDEIIAAIPGRIVTFPERLRGDAARRAWRRRGTWRVWIPPGTDTGTATASRGAADDTVIGTAAGMANGPAGDTVQPDLQDAVIVAALARELRAGGLS